MNPLWYVGAGLLALCLCYAVWSIDHVERRARRRIMTMPLDEIDRPRKSTRIVVKPPQHGGKLN